ncbi:hypothetical protein [Falsirhodobacter xinxiangensis]|uniref:hypothetical protein n=1 Tax=Falsirhodobacter xinxiangensis TaxID=2530049 RepID=UPI00145C1637|nr:hypothetical protein [Rhodobacter xinxiangensis]
MTGKTLSACICAATFAFIIMPEAASAYVGPGALPTLGVVALGLAALVTAIGGLAARRVAEAKDRRG